MFDLSGKVALVTGATGAIGGAIAETLHSLGATVILSGTKVQNLESLADKLGERVHLIACDLSSAESVEELFSNAVKNCERIDILVNNAGLTRDNLLLRISDKDWEDVMKVNLGAPFRLMRAAARGMMKARWGRIINISSVVGAVGNPGQANYSASKSGLFGLTKSVAAELAIRNVTVNCVAPGFVTSAMTDAIPEERKEGILKGIPVGRAGTPNEIAAAVAFLASNEASYITGHVLHVNGGMVML